MVMETPRVRLLSSSSSSNDWGNTLVYREELQDEMDAVKYVMRVDEVSCLESHHEYTFHQSLLHRKCSSMWSVSCVQHVMVESQQDHDSDGTTARFTILNAHRDSSIRDALRVVRTCTSLLAMRMEWFGFEHYPSGAKRTNNSASVRPVSSDGTRSASAAIVFGL